MDPSNPTAGSNPQIPLVRVAIADLRQDPGNARSHDRRNLDAIRDSLELFGQVLPVVVRQGQIVGGNATAQAALELGWTHLDATPADHLSEPEAVALAIALNRTGELADWDTAVLLESLQGLPTLEGTGYTAEELAELEAAVRGEEQPVGLTDPDEVPEPPVEPVTRPGDLWLLGPHRLLCGDATKAEDHERVLDGASVDLVLTDPPYGVNIDYGSDNYEDTPERLDDLLAEFLPIVRQWPVVLATTGVRYLWRYPAPDWTLAWVVPAGNGAGPWGYTTWTPVVAYGRDPYLARGLGSRPDSVTLMATRDPRVQGHPVIKPIEVWKWLMERGSPEPNQIILDPLAGAGTSIIAAHQLNRRCMAIELSPPYVDVACRRWQEHTGEKPTLEATGEPHDFTNAL